MVHVNARLVTTLVVRFEHAQVVAHTDRTNSVPVIDRVDVVYRTPKPSSSRLMP